MEKPRIGRIISNIRIKRGYSQEYIAFSLGISQKTFSRIEQDGESLSLARLKKISRFLDIDLQKLISFWNDENQTKMDIEAVIKVIDKTQIHACSENHCIYKDIIHQMNEDIQNLKLKLRYSI
jgi:transcriptional regulator with XRE-family HTH domain